MTEDDNKEEQNKVQPIQPFLEIFEKFEKRFKEGDTFALMEALATGLGLRVRMPEWVRDEYLEVYQKVSSYEVASWDDVLGRRVPIGKHLTAARKRNKLCGEIFINVMMIKAEGENVPTDERLFAEVGAKFNIGKTLASEYFYHYKNDPNNAGFVALWESMLSEVPRK